MPSAVLRQFIIENFLFGCDVPPLAEDESLLERGIIDSTGVLELVGFLEARFGIAVNNDEIVPENFDSVANLSKYVAARLPAPPPE